MPTLKEMRKLLSSPEFCKPCKGEELKVKLPSIEQIYYRSLTRCEYIPYSVNIAQTLVGTSRCSRCVHHKGNFEQYVECSFKRDRALNKNSKLYTKTLESK
jgi:hypothetical protein